MTAGDAGKSKTVRSIGGTVFCVAEFNLFHAGVS